MFNVEKDLFRFAIFSHTIKTYRVALWWKKRYKNRHEKRLNFFPLLSLLFLYFRIWIICASVSYRNRIRRACNFTLKDICIFHCDTCVASPCGFKANDSACIASHPRYNMQFSRFMPRIFNCFIAISSFVSYLRSISVRLVFFALIFNAFVFKYERKINCQIALSVAIVHSRTILVCFVVRNYLPVWSDEAEKHCKWMVNRLLDDLFHAQQLIPFSNV